MGRLVTWRNLWAAIALALATSLPSPAQAQLLCPDGKFEKVYDTGANWTASIWDLTSSVDPRFYYDVHVDQGGLGQIVFRAVARFAISHSSLRGRRVTSAYLTFRAAKAANVIEDAWVVPSLYNGTGLGLDSVHGLTSAQLKAGVVAGVARSGFHSFQQLDRNVGPYDVSMENEGIALLQQALNQRAATFSIAVEPLYRGVPPGQVPPHAALMKAPVLTFFHCSSVGFPAAAQEKAEAGAKGKTEFVRSAQKLYRGGILPFPPRDEPVEP